MNGAIDLLHGPEAALLARDVLPAYLSRQRWFAAKDRTVTAVRLVEVVPMPPRAGLVCIAEAVLDGGAGTQRYLLPLMVRWDAGPAEEGPHVLAKVRRGTETGVLMDATASPDFAPAIVEALLGGGGGCRPAIRFTPGAGLEAAAAAGPVRRMEGEQSNTSILIGDGLMLKVYRRPAAGVHPEIEMGRFLTEVARYPNVPPLLGSVEMIDAGGAPTAIMALQGFVANRGDGWTFTLDVLADEYGDQRPTGPGPGERASLFPRMMTTLGRRLAELHLALSRETGDPAFDPEPVTSADVDALTAEVGERAGRTFDLLAAPSLRERADFPGAEADRLLARRADVLDRVRAFAATAPCWSRTRHHGDFHLGQFLIVGDDVMLVDFEGEPSRGMDERRAKKSPLRDVAGLVRSLDYAAWAALGRIAEPRTGTKAALLAWRDLATARFLDAYRERAGDCAGLPSDPAALRRLLNLLVLEKALYEIGYEAANRPSWLPIPIAGILGLLDRG
ncbi:MAG: putative maltokinase [Alphaproteobacteria bacterium]|nr:putative maltokinase [Alphaproteobacteria bacterium]